MIEFDYTGKRSPMIFVEKGDEIRLSREEWIKRWSPDDNLYLLTDYRADVHCSKIYIINTSIGSTLTAHFHSRIKIGPDIYSHFRGITKKDGLIHFALSF